VQDKRKYKIETTPHFLPKKFLVTVCGLEQGSVYTCDKAHVKRMSILPNFGQIAKWGLRCTANFPSCLPPSLSFILQLFLNPFHYRHFIVRGSFQTKYISRESIQQAFHRKLSTYKEFLIWANNMLNKVQKRTAFHLCNNRKNCHD
jgi:hypothetical protein